ncbi:MAG: type 4b pilus protein PilO2 [Betaproteobacteria bacterium]|nr:type 4b pilus protein PilO2 [Betaproteobacteria bacterium]
MSAARIIQLPCDKRKLVVGMRWRHEDRAPTTKALRGAAKERGRWVCRRRTSMGSHQTGFASLELGRKAVAMQSLGALVADAKPEPWLGIFDLGDGLYWYIAVRDNQEILPDGDVIGNRDDIEEARARHASFGGWEYVDGDADAVLSLISGSKRSFPVLDSESRPWRAPAVGGASLLLVSAAGLMLWHRHEQAVAQQRQEALARQQALRAAMAARVPKAAAILPWTQLASAADFLQACGRAFDATPLAQDGWVLSAWDCLQGPGGQTTVDRTWSRMGGTDLRTQAGVLSADGNTVRASLPLARPLPPGAGAILASDPAERAIRGMAQTLGLPMSLTSSASQQRPTGLPGAAPVAQQKIPADPWTIWSVGIELPAPPWALGMQQPSDAVPGLRWTRIAWDGAGWTLAGSLYVGQPQPQSQFQTAGASVSQSRRGVPPLPVLSAMPRPNPMPAPSFGPMSAGNPPGDPHVQ